MFPLCLVALLFSCNRPPKAAAQVVSEAWLPPPAPLSRDADDAGRFIAGLPGSPGSAFAELEKSDAWSTHQRELDRAWNSVETGTLPAMRAFQKTELSTPALQKSLVFYPFSGPDALMMSVFFPRNPTYIMVGLEPPGTLPTPARFTGKSLPKTLADMRETVYSELHRSFFITRQMDRQFRGQVTDGLLPPILNLLVRSGHSILGWRYVGLDPQGRVVERSLSAGKVPNRGVEIDFSSGTGQPVQRLFYFSVNLSDRNLRDNQAFQAFLPRLQGASTMFKATSYMTHRDDFSLIRDGVLAHSSAILQDDSGIPYRFFASPWRVQLYGGYARPYGSFRYLEQRDLRQAYSSRDPKPLTFRIGYGFAKIPSNLQFAQKTDSHSN